MEVVVDESTIERDDGWPLPSGPNAGTVPAGRIYIFAGTFTNAGDGMELNEQTFEAHALVASDGMASFFFGCGKD